MPTEVDWSGSVDAFTISAGEDCGDTVIHHSENPDAWVHSDTTVDDMIDFAPGEVPDGDGS